MLKKPIIAILAILLLSVASARAAEESSDFNFLGGTAISYKNISFEIPAQGVKFQPHLMMLNMSGTWSYGDLFLTVNYDETIKDDKQFMTGNINNTPLIDMSRTDKDISIGYFLGKGFSIFAGYKDGILRADVSNDSTGGPGCPPGPGCLVPAYEVRFHDKGPFAGISYVQNLKESTITYSIAYADMQGYVFFGSNGGSSTRGDTTGYSASVAWNIPVAESTIFTTKANIIRYDFSDTEMGTKSGSGNPQDMSYKQKFDALSFSIAHYF